MEITAQPDSNCVIAKNSCEKFCWMEPDLIEVEGELPLVVIGWRYLPPFVGATATFLGKTITMGTSNTSSEWDGTEAGFENMIRTCFPDLAAADFSFATAGTDIFCTITFPNEEVYPNFVFDSPGITSGIGIAAQNGTAQVIRDCYFDVRIYDEDNNELCVLENQFPCIEGGEVQENCISFWNVGLETAFPPELETVTFDSGFCKKIRYRVWLNCADETAECGYSAESMIESDLFTVANSVSDRNYDFGLHCVLDRFNDGTLAKFLTELDRLAICPDTPAWLNICPSVQILDDLGILYAYGVRYTFFDETGSQIGSPLNLAVGVTNTDYIIPTGSNLLSNPLVPSGVASYTVEFIITINGNQVVISQPFSYKIVDCCCEVLLYFQEPLGGFVPLCFDEVEKRTLDASGETVCTGNKCDEETFTVGNTTTDTMELKKKVHDGTMRKLIAKATKWWLYENGEFQRVSIEKKTIRLVDRENGTHTVNLIVKLPNCQLNEG